MRWLRAAAACVVLSLALAGCGRPADEHWLRVVQFEDEDGAVTASVTSVLESSTTTITSSETSTEEQTTTESVEADYVYAVLVNASTIPGSDAQPGGVTVDEVRIRYDIPGYAPADAVIPVSVYVPAAGDTDTETTGTRVKLAVVGVGLKTWLIAQVPESVRRQGLAASAELEFHAVTDEGGDVETSASIGIEFVDRTTTSTTSTTF